MLWDKIRSKAKQAPQWSNTGTGFLERGLMPHACQCLRAIEKIILVLCFNFSSALKWSGSQTRWLLQVSSDWIYSIRSIKTSFNNLKKPTSQWLKHQKKPKFFPCRPNFDLQVCALYNMINLHEHILYKMKGIMVLLQNGGSKVEHIFLKLYLPHSGLNHSV